MGDVVTEPQSSQLSTYFSTAGVYVKAFQFSTTNQSWSTQAVSKLLRLTDENLSAALDYLFRKATLEVFKFNNSKVIKKLGTLSDGILYCNSRILEEAELKAVGHLSPTINIADFTGVNFRVPIIDHHSPLAWSIALYLHYRKYPHRGVETQHRMCLQMVSIIKARRIFSEISMDCIYCKKLRKKYLEQVMGPLAQPQLTISPVFYFTLVDLWGPLRAFVPGYEKVTRSAAGRKPHDIYMMVFACAATGTVSVEVIEGKDTAFCLDGMNRFFATTTVPKIMYADEEGGIMKALREAEVDIVDLAGTLSRQRGIIFETAPPQGHSAHGRIEKRIHMLQESLERSQIRSSRCTALGWQTIGKAIERIVNSIPLGYLYHDSGGHKPLLRVLTPNYLKLITTSDRAPVGLFTMPDCPDDIIKIVKEKYESWYHIWEEQYIPVIMNKSKWHFHKENLKPGDIVYFKLTESKMSANWRLGKVEDVKVGQDGFVRQARVAYKDTSSDDPNDWVCRTVDRPVRNMVKLFHVDDTTLLENINDVFKMSAKILEKQQLSYDIDDDPVQTIEAVEEDISNQPGVETEEFIFEEPFQPLQFSKPTRKKRKNELERLKIEMKGWDLIRQVEPLKDQKPLKPFREDLNKFKEVLSKMGSTSDSNVVSIKKPVPNLPLQVERAVSQYLDDDELSMDTKNSNHMRWGYVGHDQGSVGVGDSKGEEADNLFNSVILEENIFDAYDEIFLI